uniref:Phosphagen kinase C-terminal domain-containing protein n=1 Tax=Chromera velia CCMP2878 TaxID=1169474 RepID=A0A0G4HNI4_9ALVE|eukprot:Cvel_29452.t1-p1 / transcript=Cvel_29452.t1 / gene=Cvel_29452 / organism=Chromera_velia_CCMP2878 / gene_product=Taurocyamine kinase, putative / transcript_product=Taurocyamine kinase, putative / location=Cvel_scaffold4030:2790-8153(+) / protein_length=660 / sequence_SO=supercontig / SO=protein_coding / is_pseudo=false
MFGASSDLSEFESSFGPLVRFVHKVSEDVTQHEEDFHPLPTGLPSLHSYGQPVSLRIRVARNLRRFPLPSCIAGRSVAKGQSSFPPSSQYFEDAGVNRDWPTGRGGFVLKDGVVRVWVGEEDHLRVQVLSDSADFGLLFSRLSSVLSRLEVRLASDREKEGRVRAFARDREFGFVTSCPSNVGTGMRISVLAGFPLFSSYIREWAQSLGLQVRGQRGEASEILEGGLVDLSPRQRFSLTESQVLSSLITSVSHLLHAHQQMQKQMQEVRRRTLSIVHCAHQLLRLSWNALQACRCGVFGNPVAASDSDFEGMRTLEDTFSFLPTNLFQGSADPRDDPPDALQALYEEENGGLPPDSDSDAEEKMQQEGGELRSECASSVQGVDEVRGKDDAELDAAAQARVGVLTDLGGQEVPGLAGGQGNRERARYVGCSVGKSKARLQRSTDALAGKREQRKKEREERSRRDSEALAESKQRVRAVKEARDAAKDDRISRLRSRVVVQAGREKREKEQEDKKRRKSIELEEKKRAVKAAKEARDAAAQRRNSNRATGGRSPLASAGEARCRQNLCGAVHWRSCRPRSFGKLGASSDSTRVPAATARSSSVPEGCLQCWQRLAALEPLHSESSRSTYSALDLIAAIARVSALGSRRGAWTQILSGGIFA